MSSTIQAGPPPRRPLKSRQTIWARTLAAWLTRTGIPPNAISLASIVFSFAAAACLLFSRTAASPRRSLLLLGAAAGIQLRLLCNLLDGMVAVEGGRKTRFGEIFNDMPDRFADVLILVAAGCSVSGYGEWARTLGWLAAVMALLTAYVRLLGGSMGMQQYFIGPMAKEQRMAVLTAACLLSLLESVLHLGGGAVMVFALTVIVVGAAITLVRRTRHILADLRAR